MDQEIQRVREEYERRDLLNVSDIYEYTNSSFVFHMEEREWGILRLLQSQGVRLRGSSVLEVGCGTGHILQRFQEFGARRLAGVDLMESRIRKGKTFYPNLGLVAGNGGDLPYRDGSFDLVMQFMCLSSVLDPLLRKQIAKEMWRVLREGGSILSYDLRPASWIAGLLSIPYYAIRRIARLRGFTTREERRQPGESPNVTPVKPLSWSEIRRLYPRGQWKRRSLSLRFDLCRVSKRSFLLALMFSYIPFLRSHWLVLIRKPVMGAS
jgi:ubiquinone/menaquinone biosynthesis C-methylase UbiE